MDKGFFISFEGVEGAGKSTQVQGLADHLEDQISQDALDYAGVIVTRQPGGSVVGAEIRKLVLHPPGDGMNPWAELLLLMADRAQHVAEVIKPRLYENYIVICDRYTDCSVAYQGFGRQLPIGDITTLNRMATQGLTPDLTLLLDMDPLKSVARATDRNRMEDEHINFHRSVRQGYLLQQLREPERITLIDADQSKPKVHTAIWETVIKRLME